MKARTSLGALAAAGLLLATTSSVAADCTGVSVGNAKTTDVTLGAASATACDIATVNPQQGANGNTSGFSDNYGGGWTLLAKITSPTQMASHDGVDYAISFSQTSDTAGTWTITASQAVTVDLVFAMHASNHSGAFLFDDAMLPAASALNGSWNIAWLNNGGQVPDYSNLTIFARDQTLNPVPEPESWAMLLAGLGAVGAIARRRARSA